MAALTANSWTVVITDRHIHHKERIVYGTMAIPAVDTYPTGGIPLPTKDKFGFVATLNSLILTGHDSLTDSFTVSFDKTNNKLQLYGDQAAASLDSLDETPNTDVPGPRTWNFVARGW